MWKRTSRFLLCSALAAPVLLSATPADAAISICKQSASVNVTLSNMQTTFSFFSNAANVVSGTFAQDDNSGGFGYGPTLTLYISGGGAYVGFYNDASYSWSIFGWNNVLYQC